jgi:hypothetical protein
MRTLCCVIVSISVLSLPTFLFPTSLFPCLSHSEFGYLQSMLVTHPAALLLLLTPH